MWSETLKSLIGDFTRFMHLDANKNCKYVCNDIDNLVAYTFVQSFRNKNNWVFSVFNILD